MADDHPGRGALKAASYASRRVEEALAEFKRLQGREARAAFADHWIGLWARDFDDAWPMVYELLRIVRDDQLYTDPRRVGPDAAGGAATHGEVGEYRNFAAYFEDRVKRPFQTWDELERTHRFVSEYAPDLFNKSFTVAQERSASLESELTVGKEIHKGNSPSTGDNITSNETGKGTSADYLTRRIARDHPEVFERMKAGEYRSVRAAALDAGIVHRTQSVRVDDPDSAARALRKHMSPEALSRLVALLAEEELPE